jgi:hypothetical protein
MAELGGKVGRHTKGDRNGVKAERPNTRIVPKSRFRRLATIEEVAAALFGGLGDITVTPGREAAHRAILLRHLRANARSSTLPDDGDREWLERARRGEFSSMPEEFDFDRSKLLRANHRWISAGSTGGVRRSPGLLLDELGRGKAHRDLERNGLGALAGTLRR